MDQEKREKKDKKKKCDEKMVKRFSKRKSLCRVCFEGNVLFFLSSSYLSLNTAAALADALQNGLTVLVQLELVDDNLGGVDAEGNGLAVGLLPGDALNVDNVLKAVDGGNLALTALVAAADDGDLVILADGKRADLYEKCC